MRFKVDGALASGAELKNSIKRSPVSRKGLFLASAGVAAAVTAAFSSLASAQITVLQVEAGISAGSPAYAPVEFGSNTSVTGASTGFTAITTLNRIPSVTGNSYSSHAQVVATNFYGPGSVGATAINKVYVDAAITYNSSGLPSSVSFLSNTLKIPTTTTVTPSGTAVLPTATLFGVGPAPVSFGNGIRVSNHSYVIQTSSNTLNTELLRRADYLIDMDNHVWVAGAVNGTQFVGGDGTTTLAWQPRNAIAVRGDSAQTPFTPSLGRAGRQHADVWGSNLASFISGTVAGYSAALINQGINNGSTAAQDARVIKSVLMTGANKAIRPTMWNTSGDTWQPTTANNLDPQSGTGRVDYNASLAILNAGQRSYVSAAGTLAGSTITAGSTPSTVTSGFGLGSIATNTTSVVLLHFEGPLTNFSSTLNWNWTSSASGGNINTGDGAVIAPDLAYELRPVTWSGSQYVLGSAISSAAGRNLVSDATGLVNDNVEHLYLTSNSLGAGTYALVIRGSTTTTTTAAMSYVSTVGAASVWSNNTANAAFSTGSNWGNGFAPNGVSVDATFPNVITAARTIDLTSNTTLGTLNFSASNTYTLSSSTSATLTLTDGALGAAAVNVSAGAPVLDLPVVTPNNTSVTFSGTGTALTARSLANTGTFSVSGPGQVNVTSTISGIGSLTVGAGSTVKTTNPGSGAGNVRVLEQAAVNLNGTAVSPATLIITGEASPLTGSRATKAQVAVLSTLTIANNGAALGSRTYYGTVDLQSNDMILRGMTEASVRDMVGAWWNGGQRNGAGLASSLASAGNGPDALATLAVISNSNGSGGSRFSSFDGVTGLIPSDVIVKYTYLGDTNLSGLVDANDLAATLAGIRGNLTGWSNGDNNYDGVVNGDDLANLLRVMKLQGASFGDGSGSGISGGVVPEPAALGLVALVVPALMRRRRV